MIVTRNKYLTHKLLFLFLLIQLSASAQNKVISGLITDKETGKPLPFAAIALKHQLLGTISNEEGIFEFVIPANTMGDTLQVSYLGYQDSKTLTDTINNQLHIQLLPASVMLKEFTVLPMPPVYYIKRAASKIEDNFPTFPFITESYFSERILENGKFIKHNEAVFKTYFPAFLDTLTDQSQLLLFRKEDNIHKIEFRRDKMEKSRARKEKKALKKGKEYKEKGDILDESEMFGGPDEILLFAKIKTNKTYLDSTSFKDYIYTFDAPTLYQDRELMVINIKPVKKSERISATVFIDVETDAIVAIKDSYFPQIPLAIKPLLFLLGINVDNIRIEAKKNYKLFNNKWYPDNIQFNIGFELTKRRMFKENEISFFQINQLLNTNKIRLNNIAPIPGEKQFDSKKGFENQEPHNDDKLSWKDISIVKPSSFLSK